MYFNKTPFFFEYIFRDAIWRIPHSKNIYLTFDDGPHPETTPLILKALRNKSVQATFFCLGSQVEKYPYLKDEIIKDNHLIASHGYEHITGWQTPNRIYFNNIKKADKYIASNLFRPPYGKLTYSQYTIIKKTKKIIIWDVMPGDFDMNLSKEKVLKNYNHHVKNGSIVALHDNIKSLEKTIYLLDNLSPEYNYQSLKCLDK